MSIKGQSFNGDTTGALVNFGVGSAANIFTGAFTWVCLAKFTSTNWGMGAGFSGGGPTGTQQGGLLLSANSGGRLYSINDFTNGFPDPANLASPGLSDDVWRWCVITKPAGAAHYRYHYADISTLTWVHGESVSSANQNNQSAINAISTWSVYAMGFDSGDMAVMAGFNYEMTDGQVQAACTRALRDLRNPASGAPLWGTSFPNKSYGLGKFGDFTQGGGDSTLNQLTAASADPPGFDFGIVVENDPAWVTAGASSAVGLNSASFNTSAGSLIIAEGHVDGTGGSPPGGWTIGDSLGNSLPWIEIGTFQTSGGGGGFVRVWSAYVTAAQTGITVNMDFQSNNAKALKVTTYLGTDPNTPPVSLVGTSSSTNDATPSATNGYAGGWIAGSGLDWNALGTPTSVDQGTGYNISGLISGISVRETTARSTAGNAVPLDFDGFGTGTPAWAIKMWEIVPAPVVVQEAPANAPNMLDEIPPDLFMYLVNEYSNLWATSTPQTQVQPELGTGTLGLSGHATAVKVAPQSGTASIGFAPYGPTQGVRAQSGRACLGLSAQAVATKIQAQQGRAMVGLSGTGAAAKKQAQVGTVTIGLVARAVAVKVAPELGRVLIGLSGSGVAVKKQAQTGAVAIGFSGSGVEAKKQPQSGTGYMGFAPYGPTQGQRNQSGRCFIGLGGRGTAVHLGLQAGRTALGLSGSGTGKKSVGLNGTVALGMSGRATVAKRVLPSGAASLGMAGFATAKHISANNGRALLGLSGQAQPGKRLQQSGRAFIAFSGSGTVFKPVAIDHDAGPTLLLVGTRPIRIHTGTQIGLKRTSKPIRIHETEQTQ